MAQMRADDHAGDGVGAHLHLQANRRRPSAAVGLRRASAATATQQRQQQRPRCPPTRKHRARWQRTASGRGPGLSSRLRARDSVEVARPAGDEARAVLDEGEVGGAEDNRHHQHEHQPLVQAEARRHAV